MDKQGARELSSASSPLRFCMRQEFSKETQERGSLSIYLREIAAVPLLKPEEEKELARRIKKGDQQARSHMIRANLRLVVKIAHDYMNLGLPIQDLISEGNMGLMKAVERFDETKGVKLSTYAAWWIKQAMKRALANQSKTIRLPVHVVDKLSRIRRTASHLSEILGREPTDHEISEELGMPEHKVSELKTISLRPSSLDAPLGEDNDAASLGEIVADEGSVDPSESLRDKALQNDLLEVLEELDHREREILKARFGLDGSEPMTLEMIGEKFKVTRERIRQIQNIALEKIRRKLEDMEVPIGLSTVEEDLEVV
jgi:RNA polymerase primary sigma factor